jgi:hypothetical protein
MSAAVGAAQTVGNAKKTSALIEQADESLLPVDLEIAEPKSMRVRLPLIEGAFVVYMGAARNKSVALVGRVYVNETETGEMNEDGSPRMYVEKTVSPEGIQAYDFATHDTAGRLIRSRMVPKRKPYDDRLWGKPFSYCEHAEHLRMFLRMRNQAREREFELLIPPKMRQAFYDYVRVTEERLKVTSVETDEVINR